MNYTSANMGFIKDAELYILYLRIYYALPLEKAEAFKHEQELWLNERKEYCENEVESHGGTLALLEYGLAFITKTNARILQLSNRIAI